VDGNSERVDDAANVRKFQLTTPLIERLDQFADEFPAVFFLKIHVRIVQEQCHRPGNPCRIVFLNGVCPENAGVVLRKFSQQAITEIVKTDDGDDRKRQHQSDAEC